ncbi:hypothetical protein JYU34_004609 [Plutella xylostella]|uniref:Uncharacterized protein n=1 Tax=Plutella xylostella TaxID=51655 RepID=A0ABQ7QYD7_PLUXY|nr:hypothetical protein JYU34_004609 [Plutella xylostella]
MLAPRPRLMMRGAVSAAPDHANAKAPMQDGSRLFASNRRASSQSYSRSISRVTSAADEATAGSSSPIRLRPAVEAMSPIPFSRRQFTRPGCPRAAANSSLPLVINTRV